MPDGSQFTVRPLTIDELPLCEPFARGFYAEKQVPGDFSMEKFVTTWSLFLTAYPAVLLSLWRGEALIGGLGGLITPDLYDGRITATEMFWYVTPEERKRTGWWAWALVDAFEAWGKEHGAVESRLSLLLLDMADQENPLRLLPLYKRRGYRPVDLTCMKPLGGA